jgi:transcriptional regulator with XRE-family HTH domain
MRKPCCRCRRSARDLERELGFGHGTVSNVLRGRSELSFRHLELFSRALGFTLPELFVEAYGLCQPDDLQTRIAQAVRTELDAFWDQHGSRIENTRGSRRRSR